MQGEGSFNGVEPKKHTNLCQNYVLFLSMFFPNFVLSTVKINRHGYQRTGKPAQKGREN